MNDRQLSRKANIKANYRVRNCSKSVRLIKRLKLALQEQEITDSGKLFQTLIQWQATVMVSRPSAPNCLLLTHVAPPMVALTLLRKSNQSFLSPLPDARGSDPTDHPSTATGRAVIRIFVKWTEYWCIGHHTKQSPKFILFACFHNKFHLVLAVKMHTVFTQIFSNKKLPWFAYTKYV